MIDIKNIVVVGYSGHSFVCIDNALLNNYSILGYCDNEEKKNNPYNLNYLGVEGDFFCHRRDENVFIAIGDNKIRQKVFNKMNNNICVNLIHPTAKISNFVDIFENANVLINAGVIINPLAKISEGVILNTGCIIEHECEISDFAHIAPGVVLAGNVKIGKRSFIGANSVVKQGVEIGSDVIVGAGSVIINNIPNGVTVVGNPGKIIKINS